MVCGCLPMCDWTDMIITLHALPTRTGLSSPWHSYLSSVYGHSIPPSKTVDISALELFYLSRLPVQWCNTTRCANCDGWLDDKALLRFVSRDHIATATATATALQAPAGRDHSATAIAPMGSYPSRYVLNMSEVREAKRALNRSRGHNIDGVLAQPRHTGVLHLTSEDRSGAPSHSWVEVFRRQQGAEGVGYGCWTWRARGSGVFVNVKRTLSVAERAAKPGRPLSESAYGTLGGTTCSNNTFMGRAIASASYAKRVGRPVVPFCANDFLWATRAQALGYSSIQVRHSNEHKYEIILSNPSCTDQLTQINLCLPSDVELRTGWNASSERGDFEGTFMERKC